LVATGLTYAGVLVAAAGSGGLASLPAALIGAAWMGYHYWQAGKCNDRAMDDYLNCLD